jgi:hypothetical protein
MEDTMKEIGRMILDMGEAMKSITLETHTSGDLSKVRMLM